MDDDGAFHIREESINYSVNDFVSMAVHLGKKVNYLNYIHIKVNSGWIKELNKNVKLLKN